MLQMLIDVDGNYSFDWQWYDYYNCFEVSVVVGVCFGDQMKIEVFGFFDIIDCMKEGVLVIVLLVFENVDFFYNFCQFELLVKSNDQ